MNNRLIILDRGLLPFFSFAQHRFEHLNIDDGLIQNSITEIYQDTEGYLWFATQDGISKYDGYQFTNYNTSNTDSTSLSDNYLWGFTEDDYGGIWVCSRNGLNRLDKKTGVWNKFFVKDGSNNKLGLDQMNDVVIFNGKVYCTNASTIYCADVIKKYKKTENRISKEIIIESDSIAPLTFYNDKVRNELFVIHYNGIYNLTTKNNIVIPDFEEGLRQNFLPSCILDSISFIFSNGASIYEYNSVSKEVHLLFNKTEAIIYGIEKIKNEIWVATNKGIKVYEDNTLKYEIVKSNESDFGLSSSFVSAVFKDKMGKVWLGTSGNGINSYDSRKERFKYLSKETFGENIIVRDIVQDANNRVIVCGDKSYVIDLKKANFSEFDFAQQSVENVTPLSIKGFPNLSLTAIENGFNKDLIVGSKGEDLFILDSQLKVKKQIVLNEEKKQTNVVSDIIKTSSNEIWITTYYGVYVLDENYVLKERFLPHEKGLTSNYFLSVYEDSKGGIWLGSNTGIYFFNSTLNEFESIAYNKKDLINSPGFNFTSAFADFSDGYLWLATYGGGLSRMDLKSRTFKHYTTASGLANNVCNGLLKDNNGKLWINTNKGISQFDPKTEKFVNYGKADGLHFNEFNLNSFYQNESGQLFFGTPVGLVIFQPEDITISEEFAPIVFTGLDINYKESKDRLTADIINLYPEDKSVTIYFAGLNYSNSSKIKYRYLLKGYNNDWVETDNLSASYTSLPDGEFTFLVNTSNQDGIWNENPKEIKIIVHPPFYKTWWFLLVTALVMLSIAILVIRYFSQRKIKKRLVELSIQQQVHQEKQRISRDLHDNIGAQITYLISSIDQEAYRAGERQGVFDGLSDKARNVMAQLRQTLWVISKEEISLDDFADKIRDYSTRILSAANINCSVSYHADKSYHLSPTVVSNLFRIIQEAENNVVKHAEANEVKIDLNLNDYLITLKIMDDGKGLEEIKQLDDHFGLKNMKDRAAELGGNIKIIASNGCHVIIEIPINKANDLL